ncbi:MAG: tRNA(Ile)(2)-agmatinylcytidine synthase [Candidatus Methanomethylophilaceae archaeon]
MFVAVDDTDSLNGNCTTFLATEIIKEMIKDHDLIEHPRLVRLNPAVPWKTRGNGSLVMQFGHGCGQKKFIGVLDRKKLYCFSDLQKEDSDLESICKRLIPIVEANHSEDANPGMVITNIRPDPLFYTNGVRTIMDRKTIETELKRIDAKTFTIGNGRGIIGATCGLAWIPVDTTFELLAYRHREKWGTPRQYDPLSVRDMDHTFLTTFNSWEDRENKVAMIPATPCPVLYGLRGDDLSDLIAAADTLVTEDRERWVVFLTNQGTDDHIIHEATELIPNQSYSIIGTVIAKAHHIKGGHTFIDIDTRYGTVTCGAYEPSKEFRLSFDQLIPGDTIEVLGEFRESPRTLNVEKLHVIDAVKISRKLSNPTCPECHRKMDSIGKGQGYRCRACHIKTKDVPTENGTRWILPGWYEPPTASRRHLSKPLKRMGLEQPVEFVNKRTT